MDDAYEEKIQREPPMGTRMNPENYLMGKSEKEAQDAYERKYPSGPPNDLHTYQDTTNLEFPFFVDAPQLIFIGRLCEEPVSAYFTIVNSTTKAFWYKVKASNREMFKVRSPVGKIDREESATISVIFYPGFHRPKAYCYYLHVYALYDDGRSDSAYLAFTRPDNHCRPAKKRIFMDFIWHPHVEITRAFEYGELLDMVKSKNEYDLKNGNDKKKQKRKNGDEPPPDLLDVTYDHREMVIEKMLKNDVKEKHRRSLMTTEELSKYMAKVAENKNKNKIAVLCEKPLENYDRQKAYLDKRESRELANQLWKEYMVVMKKKGYKETSEIWKVFTQEQQAFKKMEDAKRQAKREKEEKEQAEKEKAEQERAEKEKKKLKTKGKMKNPAAKSPANASKTSKTPVKTSKDSKEKKKGK
ncbi:hypothetical protein B9Z55_006846 [Caenorhabditis nigoni]|uniref:Major sperm protein n=1 Tax=Caenorhabditis nigoni TaxID=1611254 RepID=A0A2G5V6W7_9PELO|nr:hypothetical protein B9Z55_006846 [Caenorhabditis nigoni]